jgi:HPt (histidine-containing phosphotransfer) domain-containing protein
MKASGSRFRGNCLKNSSTSQSSPAVRCKNGSSSESSGATAALAQLNEEFAQELPERLTKLQLLVPAAANGSPEALKQIIAESHRLRGTVGSFGLPSLINLMADIEDCLRSRACR